MANSSTISRPQAHTSQSSLTNMAANSNPPSCQKQVMKSVYQADQQVKYLHLQAEVESLLLELQTIKSQKTILTEVEPSSTLDADRN
jgi:hypothetical protein